MYPMEEDDDEEFRVTVKVSVCIVTYNQKDYIHQCIQSILDQKTNFSLEVIIGDDFSTDGTREIVKKYIKEYPNLITGIFHKKNIGPTQNYFSVHNLASGDYIAHLDGDDYALPGKLQIQADFLDSHPECAVACHYMQLIDKDGTPILSPFKKEKKISNIKRLLNKGPFFSHSSKMYRRSSNVFRQVNCKDECVDFIWHVEHAISGHIGFIQDFLGAYRLGVGISACREKIKKHRDLTLKAFDRAIELGVKTSIVDIARLKCLLRMSFTCYLVNDIESYQEYLKAAKLYVKRLSVMFWVYLAMRWCPSFLVTVSHLVRPFRYVQKLKFR